MRLLGLKSFRHGVHPPEAKDATAELPIRQFPFAPLLVVPLVQHAGKPSIPVVLEGQEVVRGQLGSAGADAVAVEGSAWMDREWATSALSPDLAGWDWFALQLDDGAEVMLYLIRDATGGYVASAGSYVTAHGRTLGLAADAFTIEPTGASWTSPDTGAVYDTKKWRWLLSTPSAHADSTSTPVIGKMMRVQRMVSSRISPRL